MKEAALLHRISLELADHKVALFRNSVGMMKDERGNYVRYGVCNPGGSDLIGFMAVTVTPEMVGKRVAIFTAIEGKCGRTATTDEQAQFISAVYHAGGIALIARDTDGDGDVAGKVLAQASGR